MATLPAKAQEPILDFTNDKANGRDQTCLIYVTEDGALHQRPGTNELSSFGAGGRPGRLEVTATHNSFKLSIEQPFGFRVAPQDGNQNVVFTSSFSGTGATNFSLRPGNERQKLQIGTTHVEAHLVADRGGDSFPAGTYQAQLTVRCE
ncbi:MAG: hypothetical protein KDJ80_15640 [Nitratireductor sp.]|nr:hypothetical protein [Nitratireductor sp.]